MRKLISATLVITLLLTVFTGVCSTTVSAADADGSVPAGYAPEGTAIRTAEEFAAMTADGKYYLAADVTLTASYAADFSGTLDGNGKTVTLSAPMFLTLNGATVKNLKTVGQINYADYAVGNAMHVGAVAAVANLSTLENLVNDDKCSVNSAAVRNPKLISDAAEKFGSQCVIVAIDVRRVGVYENNNPKYNVFVKGGREDTGIDAIYWAKEAQKRGAGEILLTSMDADGTKNGFDNYITSKISKELSIPVIASGGAGNKEHFLDTFNAGADAALAASLFHFRELEIGDLKKYLKENGVEVRI